MCATAFLIAAAQAAAAPLSPQAASGKADLLDVANPAHPDYCGIQHTYTQHTVVYFEGGGVTVGDFDSDGWDDVYLPANKGSAAKLYRNVQNGTFVDVAASLGVADPMFAGGAALFLDYDNDGDLDLYVVSHAGNPLVNYAPDLWRLYRNSGASGGYQFHNVTSTAGFVVETDTSKTTTRGWMGGVCAGDYDLDGYQDLFSTYWYGGSGFDTKDDLWRLWRSTPNSTAGDPSIPTYTPRVFIDETFEAGLDLTIFPGEAWQPTFVDINKDGWPDLHVAIDFGLDYMLINNKNGTFTDVASAIGLNGSPAENRNEMGTGWGDVDHDMDLELHTTNVAMKDRFYRNDSVGPNLAFVDVGLQTGLFDSVIGWGTTFFDYDNDMDLDHATSTGMRFPATAPYVNNLHINLWPMKAADGISPAWANLSATVPDFSKTNTPEGDSARALAQFDYDNDGDLDLIASRQYDPVAVYQNTLPPGTSWVQIALVEKNGSKNTTGVKLYLRAAQRTQYREVLTGSSFISQESARQHFGLGSASMYAVGGAPIDWLLVQWMDGRMQLEKNLTVRAINTVTRGKVDATGDLDGNGHVNADDRRMLETLIANPSLFAANHPDSPGKLTGDCDHNGLINVLDLRKWDELRKY